MNCDNCKHTRTCTRVWRNSKKECPHYIQTTNADHIRSMKDAELAEFLEYLYSHCDGPWEILFERKFCDHCPAPEYELEDGRNLKLHECDFTGGKCPHGSDVLWWLKQPYKEET